MPEATPSKDDALRTLLDRDALRALVDEYARAADRRDYPAFAEIFTADGRISGHRGDPYATQPLFAMEGREAIVKGQRGLERYEKTFHQVGGQRVSVEGDVANGETYCVAHHVYRKDGVARNRTLAIRYQDRFVREGGRWLFSERRLAIDWERDAPLGEAGWA